jgi:uncharacterized protein (TIGR03067 family)
MPRTPLGPEAAMSSFSRSDESHHNAVKSIDGTWIPIHSVGDGEQTSDEDLRDITLFFANGRCEVRRAEVLIRQGAYSVDTAKIPCELDVCFEQSDVPELIDATLKGIYQVDRDHLRICYGAPGGGRASSFSGEKGTGQYLAKYRASPQQAGESR